MAKEICEDCGKAFEAGANQYLCNECRKTRLSNYAKARDLSKIGRNAYRAQLDKLYDSRNK